MLLGIKQKLLSVLVYTMKNLNLENFLDPLRNNGVAESPEDKLRSLGRWAGGGRGEHGRAATCGKATGSCCLQT